MGANDWGGGENRSIGLWLGAISMEIEQLNMDNLTPIEENILLNSEDGNIREDCSKQRMEIKERLSSGQLQRSPR